MFWFSFFYTLALFAVQLIFKNHRGRLRFFYFLAYVGAILVVSVAYILLVYFQYIDWTGGDAITKYFVPPHRGWGYVFGYYFVRFLLYYLISFAVSVFFVLFAMFLSKKFGGVFFRPEEPFLGAISIFLLGHRDFGYWWIIYALLVFGLALAGSFVKRKRLGDGARFSFYWLWLPSSLLVIILRGLIFKLL